jgi:hypothetical protein
MRAEAQNTNAIEAAVTKIEVVEGFQRALDRQYQQLRESARTSWERLFAGNDPSDACVSVRIHPAIESKQPRTLPGSGFLKTQKPVKTHTDGKRSLPRFAH